ncbi:choice-of-anchor L domain-containing protein [Aureisphaera galaxeae]|uniref:T9SS type B sorting domain-containing protein n=1 Tax=Aureisphaera galaxeae TaxID=1538023 RepID=UPI002350E491|nr:T9SS type B sorting domain-containing protein [Aureisphaera galaxeae]MDC8003117.1 choice-of-anchor L domain-containing protein [Aureisphaera galaxeae]
MKRWVLIICVLMGVQAVSQITVDESYTTQEMVEDILINSPCAEVSFFSSSTGTDFNEVNGIGVFTGNGSGFPFDSGVILSTGDVLKARGPNDSIPNSDGTIAWRGDLDLEDITNVRETSNASSIEFHFIPLSNRISFDFILASEEYNQSFECNFSDTFAFILTRLDTGESRNLAVLPGTSTPITVTNIHPLVEATPNTNGCPARNENFFDTYNFPPFRPRDESPTDFGGQTVVLTARGNVISGEEYVIKLVIADSRDTLVDTAVFIGGNTFNIGIELGEDLTLENGNAPCEGDKGVEIGVEPDSLISFQWFLENPNTGTFEIIPGATSSTFFATQEGTYRLRGSLSSGCVIEDDILVEFGPIPVAGPPLEYVLCNIENNDVPVLFDLTNPDIIAQILDGQDPSIFVVTFYETLADAQAAENPLPDLYENSSNPQTIYVRIAAGNTNCFDITTLQLEVRTIPFVSLEELYRICVDAEGAVISEEEGEPSPTLIETGLGSGNFQFQWFLNGQLLENETGSSISPEEEGIYSVTISDLVNECSASLETRVVAASPPFTYTAEVTNDFFAETTNIEAAAEGLGIYVFRLDDGPFQENGLFENVASGSHTLLIKDATGCGSVLIPLLIVDYPKLLTPNQDGYHDRWNIFDLAEIDPDARVYIFDRFGKLLKELRANSRGWDGTFHGNPLPSSDYWFRVDYTEEGVGKTFRGHFTLKR